MQMKTLQFSNGDQMPIFGLGTWKANPGDTYKAVKEALRLGYTHIDCAPIYGNEAEVGKALKESFDEGIVSRDQLWITSKLWNNAHEPRDVQPAIEKTLADLQVDSVDLFLVHWPVIIRRDVVFHKSANDLVSLDEIPVSETWAGVESLVDKGLCKHIGVSNFSVAKLRPLVENARIKPEMNQIELHPYLQQPAMLDFCDANGMFLTAYAPLGSSDRPARLKVDDEPILLEDPVIAGIAERHTISPAQVLISWAIHRGTGVIPKSIHSERLAQNLAAAEVVLTEGDIQEIAGLDLHRRYVSGSFWVLDGGPYTLENIWDE